MHQKCFPRRVCSSKFSESGFVSNRLMLVFFRCSKTVDRNLEMIDNMKKMLSGEEAQEEGKKPVKPQDLARLYETIIQVRCESLLDKYYGLIFFTSFFVSGAPSFYYCKFPDFYFPNRHLKITKLL